MDEVGDAATQETQHGMGLRSRPSAYIRVLSKKVWTGSVLSHGLGAITMLQTMLSGALSITLPPLKAQLAQLQSRCKPAF